LRGRGSSWVFLIGTFNKVSRLFSDRLQCGPKKKYAWFDTPPKLRVLG
jgi:hypothetical protein